MRKPTKKNKRGCDAIMNVAFYNEPVEKAIVQEIMQWSTEVLEKPSPLLQRSPPCPYARTSVARR